jgi:glutamine cyclotransferase
MAGQAVSLVAVLVAAVASLAPVPLPVEPAQGRQPLQTGQILMTPVYGYDVIACYPHDPKAFTQGLVFSDGMLLESTGLNGQSTLRRVRLETGEVLQRVSVARRYFAEGLTQLGDELFQLTWETGVAFVYDARTFDRRRTMSYKGEGWGLTTDGVELYLSDGSSTLRVLEPGTFPVRRTVQVTDGGVPVTRLNELEWVEGRLFANVWLTDRVAIINPESGVVEGWLDLSGLGPRQDAVTNAVLNGIAYDRPGRRLFVTGKLWPTLYQIQVRRDGRRGAPDCP